MCWKPRERISPPGREVLMGHFVVPGAQRWWDLALLVLSVSLHVFILLVVWLLETSLFRICFFFFFFFFSSKYLCLDLAGYCDICV